MARAVVLQDSSATQLILYVIGTDVCSDGLDNDLDGFTDYPDDSDCTSVTDDSENPDALPTPPVTPGGGGGGGGGGIIDGIMQIIIRGRAYPKATVTLFRDAQKIAIVDADTDGMFELRLTQTGAGTYTFGLEAQDINGKRSPLQTYEVNITGSKSNVISGILLPPTISADKSAVKVGDTITLNGFSAPLAIVRVYITESNIEKVYQANLDGSWNAILDTSDFKKGAINITARSTINDLTSTYSREISILVGSTNTTTKYDGCLMVGDLNGDCRVNLLDYSILAYWYKRNNVPANFDLHPDGLINLFDFSILAFYWTG